MAGGMFTISYAIAVIVPIICGACWDLTGLPWTSFMPMVLCAVGIDGLRHYADLRNSAAMMRTLSWRGCYLFVAGLFEIGWAIGLKYTEGFSRLVPSLLTVAAMMVAVLLLGLGVEDPAGRHRLCGLDRHRRGRHGGARHLSVRRTGDRRAACVDRD